MGFFDLFFKEKKEESIDLNEAVTDNYNPNTCCASCRQIIEDWESKAKYAKNIYHRRCLKKAKRQARRDIFRVGILK